jgi:hypothetical protein
MKLFTLPLLLCALLSTANAPVAQRIVATHGPTFRAPVRASYTHAPRHIWVPGHYESRFETVWVPARNERVWVAPVFELRFDPCGRPVQVEVCAGYWKTIHHPGCHERREVRVWVPGHYELRSRCD